MTKQGTAIVDHGDQVQEYGRRAFLRLSATTAALLGTGVFLNACSDSDDGDRSPPPVTTPGRSFATPVPVAPALVDADVLNFALDLGYLTASFYSLAVTGTGIPSSVLGSLAASGTVYGGSKVTFADRTIASYAEEIMQRELQHLTLLRTLLGSAAAPVPTIDLTPRGGFLSFAAATNGLSPGVAYDPFANDDKFLLGAYLFQDVMVTAYKSAVRLLPTRTHVDAFSGILATKSYHAGLLRTLLYRRGLTAPALRAATEAIAKLRDGFDGRAVTDRGVALNGDRTSVVAVDSDGAVYGRTLGQVLNLMYTNSGAVKSGGFYPGGAPVAAVKNTSGYGWVEQYDARLDALIDANEVVEEVVGEFNWIEGPVWIGGADGYLLTSHPRNNMITRFNERDGYSVFTTPSGMPEPIDPLLYAEPGSNGLFLGRGGVLVADGSLRLIRVLNLQSKTFTTIAERFEGKKFNSPNDFAVSPRDGSIFFTDPIFGLRGGANSALREMDYMGVFKIAPNNTVSLIGKFSFPNGIGVSPDGGTLYHTDSTRGWVAHTLDANSNPVSNRDFVPRALITGGDGFRVDATGNLWASCRDGITIVGPDGVRLGTIRTNDTAANCEIGADGYLYITSNRRLARIRVKAKKLLIPAFS